MLITPYPLKDKNNFAQFNLPENVTCLADSILELLPVRDARYFPAHMEIEIKSGNDMSLVRPAFLAWLIGRAQKSTQDENEIAVLERTRKLYQQLAHGGKVAESEWRNLTNDLAERFTDEGWRGYTVTLVEIVLSAAEHEPNNATDAGEEIIDLAHDIGEVKAQDMRDKLLKIIHYTESEASAA